MKPTESTGERVVYLPAREPKQPGLSRLKKILVAADLSAPAEKALIRAAKLAAEHDAFLEIVHVAESSRSATEGETSADQALREWVSRYGLSPGRFAIRQATAKPVVEIAAHARDCGADLIVAGEHDSRGISGRFIRTTAEAIVRACDRPVLIVKRRLRTAYRRVLVPIDFSDHSRNALQFALRLAPNADFRVLHAYEGLERQLLRTDATSSEVMRRRREFARKARAKMRAFLDTIQRGRSRLYRTVWFGQAPHVIASAAERLPADLVVIGSSDRSALSKFFMESVTDYVMRHVARDVLVVRTKPTADQFDSNGPDAA